jgi:hypothetical protein
MVISVDEEKMFNKIRHSFMVKAFNKLHIKAMYLNTIEAIYRKPTNDVIL